MYLNQYGKILLEVNGWHCHDSSSWVFTDGMGFGDEAVWWHSKWPKRPVGHEGLDFVQFNDGDGCLVNMFAGFVVISPVTGVVVGLCDDYLAQTLWIRIDQYPQKLVVLSHLHASVTVGDRLCCGDPIGDISYEVKNVPLHLHVSVLSGDWESLPKLTWAEVHRQSLVKFIYPSF